MSRTLSGHRSAATVTGYGKLYVGMHIAVVQDKIDGLMLSSSFPSRSNEGTDGDDPEGRDSGGRSRGGPRGGPHDECGRGGGRGGESRNRNANGSQSKAGKFANVHEAVAFKLYLSSPTPTTNL